MSTHRYIKYHQMIYHIKHQTTFGGAVRHIKHQVPLCDVRSTFDKYNLISGLHTYCAQNDNIYKNILPPLSLLNRNDEEELMNRLKDLKFYNKSTLAA